MLERTTNCELVRIISAFVLLPFIREARSSTAALVKVARDFAWRSPNLEFADEYLEYPVERAYRH